MLEKIKEVLTDIFELVQQTHWLKGQYEDRCPMLDADGNAVFVPVEVNGVVVKQQIFKVGYCLAGLINKRALGFMDDHSSPSHFTHRELIGLDTTYVNSYTDEQKLAVVVGERVWDAIKVDQTLPRLIAVAVESLVEGYELETIAAMSFKGVVQSLNIELWNDSVATRDDVIRVLERAIDQVDRDIYLDSLKSVAP